MLLGILVNSVAPIPNANTAAPQTQVATSTVNAVVSSTPAKVDVLPPILLKIAECESGGRQFNPDGTVLRGRYNPKDVGRFQINEKFHLAESKKLGMDIYTWEGNTKYALYLYAKNGTRDWNASSSCWGNGLDAVGTSSIMEK